MLPQELALDVEYFLAVLPPKTEQELLHDDWCGHPTAHICHACDHCCFDRYGDPNFSALRKMPCRTDGAHHD